MLHWGCLHPRMEKVADKLLKNEYPAKRSVNPLNFHGLHSIRNHLRWFEGVASMNIAMTEYWLYQTETSQMI